MNVKVYQRLVLLIVGIVCLLGCMVESEPTPTPSPTPEPTATPDTAEYWPTDGWRTSTPEEQGMDSEQLTAMLEFIQEENDFDFDSILVIRNGYVVLEIYFYPFTPTDKHGIYSAAKSFTATVVGIALDQGYIESVDQRVLNFFPDRTFENLDERKEAITIEHVLTMSSGLQYGTELDDLNNPTNNPYQRMWASGDWLQYMLDLPMEAAPGTTYNYTTGGAHILMAIVNESIEADSASFVDTYLFGPLGITDYIWTTAPDGVLEGGSSLYLTPRDMAKFGYLYLKNGVWEGEQIVSSGWVETVTTAYIDPNDREYEGYGYQWWVAEDPYYYTAHGASGQRVFVAPEENLVAVTTAHNWGISYLTEMLFEVFILGAVESPDPLPANPEGLTRLEAATEAARQLPDPEPVSPLPEIAQSVSGSRYVLEENSWGWQAISLEFQEGEAEAILSLFLEDKSIEVPVGLDNVYRITDIEAPGYYWNVALVEGPVGLQGSWLDEDTFYIDMLIFHHRVHSSTLRMNFEGDEVEIFIRKKYQPTSNRVLGILQE